MPTARVRPPSRRHSRPSERQRAYSSHTMRSPSTSSTSIVAAQREATARGRARVTSFVEGSCSATSRDTTHGAAPTATWSVALAPLSSGSASSSVCTLHSTLTAAGAGAAPAQTTAPRRSAAPSAAASAPPAGERPISADWPAAAAGAAAPHRRTTLTTASTPPGSTTTFWPGATAPAATLPAQPVPISRLSFLSTAAATGNRSGRSASSGVRAEATARAADASASVSVSTSLLHRSSAAAASAPSGGRVRLSPARPLRGTHAHALAPKPTDAR
mmetsp:Transcript_2619/g.10445  ORF Transcript_2619/g.10445 Transcript_2619/m.10445 type:complete len:274 (+) Transcript_2619:95-916(+)